MFSLFLTVLLPSVPMFTPPPLLLLLLAVVARRVEEADADPAAAPAPAGPGDDRRPALPLVRLDPLMAPPPDDEARLLALLLVLLMIYVCLAVLLLLPLPSLPVLYSSMFHFWPHLQSTASRQSWVSHAFAQFKRAGLEWTAQRGGERKLHSSYSIIVEGYYHYTITNSHAPSLIYYWLLQREMVHPPHLIQSEQTKVVQLSRHQLPPIS